MAFAATFSAPAQGQDVAYSFTWEGAGGYVMQGGIAFDSDRPGGRLVRENDVQCFVIEGFRNGEPIGRWALGQLTEETTWTLTFSPAQSAFVVYGPMADMPQAWNMNGFGENCGDPGFGFNIGNFAQDLCVDGELARDSQIAPARPFPATRDDGYVFPSDGCRSALMLSHLDNG
ncbi:MAG: hypothetical protein CMH11_14430 [Maritimibacter sp.]|nr:hypothetical protein [Maritimibacter sp.]